MKKILLITLITISSLSNAFASLPLPVVVHDVQPGGGFITAMRANEELRRQYIETQMLQQQLALMQQQRMQQNQTYDASYNNTNPANYNDEKISGSLEKNPIGQSTHWWDPNTGIKYTVTPKNNVIYRGNKNSREYIITIHAGKKCKK